MVTPFPLAETAVLETSSIAPTSATSTTSLFMVSSLANNPAVRGLLHAVPLDTILRVLGDEPFTQIPRQFLSAEGGNRTHTPRREPDFESRTWCRLLSVATLR